MKVLLSLLLFASPLSAATYYVSAAGSDTRTCAVAQVAATPRQTIKAGLACLAAGDTLILGDGAYPEGNLDIRAGTAAAPTIVRAANRNGAIVRPGPGNYAAFWLSQSFVTIDGIDADCANVGNTCSPYLHNNASKPTNITIQHGTARNSIGTYGSGIELGPGGNHLIWDNDVINSGTDDQFDHGVYVYGSNVTVDGNRIRGTAGWAVHLYHGCDGANGCPSLGIVIRNNTIYNNVNHAAVLISQATGAQVYNNVFYGNGSDDVQLYGQTSGTVIYGNTVGPPPAIPDAPTGLKIVIGP